MNVLIIEDELSAVKRLENLLKDINVEANIIGKLDSIESSVNWLQNNQLPDVILMDIQLADGSSFEIFSQVDIKAPIIFTTAYDEYAVKAFKVNSIDYLLKPIKKDELAASFQKLKNLQLSINADVMQKLASSILQSSHAKNTPKRFVVRYGERIKAINIEEIAYVFAENKNVFFRTIDGRDYPFETSLDKLIEELPSDKFYRINRQLIVNVESIESMISVSKSRVKLKLIPPFEHDSIVSTNRSGEFKNWLKGLS